MNFKAPGFNHKREFEALLHLCWSPVIGVQTPHDEKLDCDDRPLFTQKDAIVSKKDGFVKA